MRRRCSCRQSPATLSLSTQLLHSIRPKGRRDLIRHHAAPSPALECVPAPVQVLGGYRAREKTVPVGSGRTIPAWLHCTDGARNSSIVWVLCTDGCMQAVQHNAPQYHQDRYRDPNLCAFVSTRTFSVKFTADRVAGYRALVCFPERHRESCWSASCYKPPQSLDCP